MGIKDLIARIQAGEGDNEVVGSERLVAPPLTTPVLEVVEDVPEVEVPTPVVVTEAPVVVVDDSAKPKRGRKTVYDTTNLKVGEFVVYHGKLASGRVLASLKGGDGKKFQATEIKSVTSVVIDGQDTEVSTTEVLITRKA